MIRHLALAILLVLIAAAPAAAAPQTHLGSYATGPALSQSFTAKANSGTTSTGPGTGTMNRSSAPFLQGEFKTVRTTDLHLPDCAYCSGHDGGVGWQSPN